MRRISPVLLLALSLGACADATSVAATDARPARDAAPDAVSPPLDAARLPRDAAPRDAAPPAPDATPPDAAPPAPDAAPPDAAPPAPDAAPPPSCIPEPETCNARDDDCDGRIDEDLPLQWPDNDGDGYGEPSGPATCVPAPGLIPDDRDCDDGDPNVSPDAEDLPDPDFADTNCDGIDGDYRRLLFVRPDAPPDDRQGTRERPFGTIAEALEAAAMRPGIEGIALAVGRYEERVTLVDGVSVYGGYDPQRSWARGARVESVIAGTRPDRGRIVGVVAEGLREPTALDLVTVEASGDPGPGGSLYAVYARNAPGLSLRAVTARAGDAPGGIDGADGAPGDDGAPGQDGGACGQPPGAGGASACGAGGGAGGAGSPRGVDGQPGQFPGCGGTGGPRGGGGAGGDGGHGCNPAAPGAGADGPGGLDGGLDAEGWWSSARGTDGAAGPAGAPGGGGGGGGGAAVIDGTGGGGGGGGAGGCGGRPGLGGTGGGGSFALFAVDSPGLTITACDFRSGSGGAGGSGGHGGAPGAGAGGGSGGAGREAFACGGLAGPGAGGNGGHGADGGRGGHGGGGAGGPSLPVFCVGTPLAIGRDTFLQPGVGGPGGDAPGERGHDGVSAPSSGCD
jgi:hypothetical protein